LFAVIDPDGPARIAVPPVAAAISALSNLALRPAPGASAAYPLSPGEPMC
jgi:hypothetical protein